MGLFSLHADENIALLCKKENIKFGSCLVNRLQCYYRKDCGWEYMLMKLICSGFEMEMEMGGSFLIESNTE
ncbi:putative protein BEAN1 [Triplophysa rosa]|uniref:Uncharacterized protein n=1 Tax=Triplophysa rosa TaxID=992332 RepID=A0A9W7X6F4_TRIRA|nr:putative protein BEAN1 [Triplophysa rosa]